MEATTNAEMAAAHASVVAMPAPSEPIRMKYRPRPLR
jgi:hypothetical protein